MIDTSENFFELKTTKERKEWLTYFVYDNVTIDEFLEDDSIRRLVDLDEEIAIIEADIEKLKYEQRGIKEIRKRILENHFNEDCYQTESFKRFLYWTFRGSSVKASEAREVVLWAQSKCNECGEVRKFNVKIKSWSDLDRISSEKRHHYNIPLCECQRKAIQSRDDSIIQYQQRIRELATMPYKEYLQTPEWKETRKRALKRAGFSCQLCNSKDKILNVHHRTYERRGNEQNNDLIVLCEDCHRKFHDIKGD